MDPYLERRGLWEEVHTRLIVALADALSPLVRPGYRVAVEQWTYLALVAPDDLVGKPDVLVIRARGDSGAVTPVATPAGVTPLVAELPMPEEVVERYLEVRDVVSGEVITVIELLSLTNKVSREGRRAYEEKRLKVLGSQTHLIEIDLLRAGEPMAMRVQGNGHRAGYRIVVSRAHQRPWADVYLFGLREAIPPFPVPLRRGEAEPVIALNTVLHELYDRAAYDLAIDYRREADPPLKGEDAVWADALLREHGLRP
jgi:hypothetical protein